MMLSGPHERSGQPRPKGQSPINKSLNVLRGRVRAMPHRRYTSGSTKLPVTVPNGVTGRKPALCKSPSGIRLYIRPEHRPSSCTNPATHFKKL
jgi:hypothetical protein